MWCSVLVSDDGARGLRDARRYGERRSALKTIPRTRAASYGPGKRLGTRSRQGFHFHCLNGFRLHQTAMYLEGQTQFGDIPWPREGSAGVFRDSAQAVAHGVRVAMKCLSRTAHRRIVVLPVIGTPTRTQRHRTPPAASPTFQALHSTSFALFLVCSRARCLA